MTAACQCKNNATCLSKRFSKLLLWCCDDNKNMSGKYFPKGYSLISQECSLIYSPQSPGTNCKTRLSSQRQMQHPLGTSCTNSTKHNFNLAVIHSRQIHALSQNAITYSVPYGGFVSILLYTFKYKSCSGNVAMLQYTLIGVFQLWVICKEETTSSYASSIQMFMAAVYIV